MVVHRRQHSDRTSCGLSTYPLKPDLVAALNERPGASVTKEEGS
jgi:hypothetical protein